MVRPVERWACDECGEVYGEEDEAADCCSEEVAAANAQECLEDFTQDEIDTFEEARCGTCKRLFVVDLRSLHFGADKYKHRRDAMNTISIHHTGHCRICTPHYTHEQQQAIEDTALALFGEPEALTK